MSKNAKKASGEIRYDIVQNLGVLSTSNTGWSKEVNIVCWNDSGAKLDIRDWDDEHRHMSKGITLHVKEVKELYEILEGLKQKDFDFQVSN